jgi:hypothetical protein
MEMPRSLGLGSSDSLFSPENLPQYLLGRSQRENRKSNHSERLVAVHKESKFEF